MYRAQSIIHHRDHPALQLSFPVACRFMPGQLGCAWSGGEHVGFFQIMRCDEQGRGRIAVFKSFRSGQANTPTSYSHSTHIEIRSPRPAGPTARAPDRYHDNDLELDLMINTTASCCLGRPSSCSHICTIYQYRRSRSRSIVFK